MTDPTRQPPFALMADSIETISRFADVDETAERLLQSAEAPIVLLDKKEDSRIATSVAEGTATLGFMLCYAPLHFLLFAEGIDVLVMTSGNISDQPLICNNDKAQEKLGSVRAAEEMEDPGLTRLRDIRQADVDKAKAKDEQADAKLAEVKAEKSAKAKAKRVYVKKIIM